MDSMVNDGVSCSKMLLWLRQHSEVNVDFLKATAAALGERDALQRSPFSVLWDQGEEALCAKEEGALPLSLAAEFKIK